MTTDLFWLDKTIHQSLAFEMLARTKAHVMPPVLTRRCSSIYSQQCFEGIPHLVDCLLADALPVLFASFTLGPHDFVHKFTGGALERAVVITEVWRMISRTNTHIFGVGDIGEFACRANADGWLRSLERANNEPSIARLSKDLLSVKSKESLRSVLAS